MLIIKFVILLAIGIFPCLYSLVMKRRSAVVISNDDSPRKTCRFSKWKTFRKPQNLSLRFYKALKYDKGVRRAYIMLLLFLMMTIQIVDSYATVNAAETIKEVAVQYGNKSVMTAETFLVYRKFLTHPILYVFCGLLTVMLAFYKLADRLLLSVRFNKSCFITVYLVTVLTAAVSMLSSGRDIIVPELLSVFMLSAVIYPKPRLTVQPGTRKPLTRETLERYWNWRKTA